MRAPNFNPRSRKGSDLRLLADLQVAGISIHAPVKGATCAAPVWEPGGFISIHAPVKGATHKTYGLAQVTQISIHAPVKGATREAWQ